MRRGTGKKLICTFLLCFSSYSNAFAHPENPEAAAGQLPEDWFVLPEDREAFQLANSNKNMGEENGWLEGIRSIFIRHADRGVEATAKTFDRILRVNADSLEKTTYLSGTKNRPDNAPPDWVPWHLNGLKVELGVSAQGTLGILGANGTIATQIVWHRTTAAKHALGLLPLMPREKREPSSRGADVTLTDSTTELELEKKITPVVKAVMATGKVKNSNRVKAGLMKIARELQDVMSDVNFYNGSSWEVSNFSLWVGIEASGIVYHGLSVGGGVGLSFSWSKEENSDNSFVHFIPPSPGGPSAKKEAMRITTANIARDLDHITADLYKSSGFRLESISVGIGLYFGTNIGVVDASFGGMGVATFSKVQNRNFLPHKLPQVLAEEDIPLVSQKTHSKYLKFARANSVNFTQQLASADNPSGSEKVIYYMNRARFRSGLRKAAKIGAFFADRSNRLSVRQWKIDEINAGFALSLMGNVGVASVGAGVSLEMGFKRDI